ncbi:hypothetical protein TH53_02440 [Pedobacter lusitanus]|uniref:Uncharacterized protein n=2 Tax=Pedobacter lusitanus TaxID=1503925 RepID=A0A0D0GVX7_9SPHI|nr:hypothetical protein TH53_02440 [Pedobacter lusitanus]
MVLISLPAFREIGVDNDSLSYSEIFKSTNNYSIGQIISGNYESNIERGFMLLNKLVDVFGGDFNSVLFIVALLTGLLNYTIIYKICRFPFTALLIYLSFFLFVQRLYADTIWAKLFNCLLGYLFLYQEEILCICF